MIALQDDIRKQIEPEIASVLIVFKASIRESLKIYLHGQVS